MFGRAAAEVDLLTQRDGYLRPLTLHWDDVASQVSPQQITLDFTAGDSCP
jgi:hypothetical protein